MKALLVTVGLATLTCCAISDAAHAQCAFTTSGMNANVGTVAVNFASLGGSWQPPSGSFEDALGIWNSSCGNAVPSLTESQGAFDYGNNPGVVNFYVVYYSGSGPNGRCAETQTYEDANTCEITGGMIKVYEYEASGASCAPTEAQIIAHEIGHALGLADVDYNPSCNGTIMGSQPSYVSSSQCGVVDDNWYTAEEYDEQHVNDYCNQTCQGTCNQGQCTEQQPSPILINLDRRGYHLTSLADGVHFDLNADGHAELTSWTRTGSDAFLCIDRNKNGAIDDGRELFGNYTPLSNGKRASNGYEALAEFDAPALGGDGDGSIDSNDAIWPFLLVWKDDNHDGVSQPDELLTVAAAGIQRLDTHYATSRRHDQYGNTFRFRGHCVASMSNGAQRDLMTYDVFFVANP